MIKQVLKYGGMFIFLVLIQVLILNNIHLGHLITPFFYFLFILLLPFETPRYLQLLLAFFLGLTIDMFTDTAGTHAFACVLAAYARPSILGLLASRDTYESGSLPRVSTLGQSWFFRYALLMVLIHHFALFYLEVFSFSGFFGTFLRALVSSFFTIILILLSQYVIYRD
ncbi:MAG: rod shape-determining protein MreD [Bacteroidota bacterium]|nr:rod shape-determining protein MreD [Bacteroidota bacterium]MDP4205271.1 rod shape-determining protein MreD [Bacteroidota bacterium]